MDTRALYSEYRSRRFPATLNFLLEHQKFQANYAAGVITAAVVVGYFQLLDNYLSGYEVVLLVFGVYMLVNAVTIAVMDAVVVELYVSPLGISFHTLYQVLKGTRPERFLRIISLRRFPDAVLVTTDDRVLTFRRGDWPKFDELAEELNASYENGFRERYRVFRNP